MHRSPNWKWQRFTRTSCAYEFHHPCCSRSNYRPLPTPNCWTKITTIRFHKRKLKESLQPPLRYDARNKASKFQYKIIHIIIPTRCSLFRMKLCDSEICQLCKMQPQTLPRLFYRCPVISNFWSAFQNWSLGKSKNRITLTESNILFGWHDNTTESKDILNCYPGGQVLYLLHM